MINTDDVLAMHQKDYWVLLVPRDTGNIGNKAQNADKQNTKTITTKHTTQKTKKMKNIEQPALT
jgi:hypothetical protein